MTLRATLLTTLATALLLSAVALLWAPLNQDEGWYLLSARRTAAGAMPYRDYAFTQGPVFPYLYAPFAPLVRHGGLAAGRAVTLLLGWASIATVAWTVRTHRGRDAVLPLLAVIALLGLNPFHLQHLATVKTYAAAGWALAAGLAGVLHFHRRRDPRALAVGAVLLVLAAGTRLSLALFLPAIALDLFLHRRDTGLRPTWIFLATASLAAAALFLPFLLAAPEASWFGWIEFHAGRQTRAPLLLRAAFLSRTLRHHLPLALAALFLLHHHRHRPLPPGLPGLLGGALATTAVHALSPFPYDEYQTALLPAFVLAIALLLPDPPPRLRPRLASGLALAALLFAAGAPQWQQWLSAGRDRIWWRTLQRPPLLTHRHAARRILDHAPHAETLLTFDPLLAVETRLDLPLPLHMGPFSYFPDLTPARAERLHVLDNTRLRHLLRTTSAPVAALSGYAFAIQNPGITPTPPETLAHWRALVAERYRHVETLAPYGQAHTPLEIHVSDGPSAKEP